PQRVEPCHDRSAWEQIRPRSPRAAVELAAPRVGHPPTNSPDSDRAARRRAPSARPQSWLDRPRAAQWLLLRGPPAFSGRRSDVSEHVCVLSVATVYHGAGTSGDI